jgi:hypothetical protein
LPLSRTMKRLRLLGGCTWAPLTRVSNTCTYAPKHRDSPHSTNALCKGCAYKQLASRTNHVFKHTPMPCCSCLVLGTIQHRTGLCWAATAWTLVTKTHAQLQSPSCSEAPLPATRC